MNGRDRVRAAHSGKPVDRAPVVLHNFLHATRRLGITQAQYRRDPAVIARAHLAAVEAFHLDGVLVDLDTAVLAQACGTAVDLPEDMPARVAGHRFATPAEVIGLPPPRVRGFWRAEVWVAGVAELVRQSGGSFAVRGNCDQAAFSLAAEVCDPQALLTALLDEDQAEAVEALLAWCHAACSEFLGMMAETGCDLVSNGDSTSGPDVLSPRLHRRWALPYQRRQAETAHRLGVPWCLHVCGNTTRILPALVESGADALELDYKTGLDAIASQVAGKATLWGTVDPSGVVCRGDPDLVTREAARVVAQFAGNPRFVLNAGCAIPAETPDANVAALVAAAR